MTRFYASIVAVSALILFIWTLITPDTQLLAAYISGGLLGISIPHLFSVPRA